MGLNFFLIPLHELGHYLTSLVFGAQIQEVQWLGIEGGYVRCLLPYDSPGKIVIGLSGGLFAGFILFIAYMIFSRVCKLNPDLASKSDVAIFVVRSILITVLLKELINGVLEGILPDIYMAICKPLIYFAIMMVLAQFPLIIHLMMIRKSKSDFVKGRACFL